MDKVQDNKIHIQNETLFKDAVLSGAEAKSMQIIAMANKERADELDTVHLESKLTDHDIVLKKIQQENARNVSGLAQEARKDLLQRRTQLVDDMFSEIQNNLVKFAQSEKYTGWVLGKLEKCCENLGGTGGITVFIRPEDSALEQGITKAVPGCEVKQNNEIKTGGIMVRQGIFLHDLTLDTALENEREYFYENSRLTV